jgi:hypothetical protein
VKRDWEIVADNLSKAGWTWGCVPLWIVKCGQSISLTRNRDDRQRFVVHADDKFAAFFELEKRSALACQVNKPKAD